MEYSHSFFISPNESNPEGELAVNILVSNIIELSTAHANDLNIGNPSMENLGAGWVLSRLTIEMQAYPKCNTRYTLSTWIENFNRHFSTRGFAVEDDGGNVLGYGHSVWMVLDMKTHENYGLAHLSLPDGALSDRVCPISPQSKHTDILPYGAPDCCLHKKALPSTVPATEYTFKYNDIDYYRHVNTVRYVTILLNQHSLHEFDSNYVKRLEMSFLHEGRFGDTVEIRRHDFSELDAAYSLYSPQAGRPVVFARLTFAPRGES